VEDGSKAAHRMFISHMTRDYSFFCPLTRRVDRRPRRENSSFPPQPLPASSCKLTGGKLQALQRIVMRLARTVRPYHLEQCGVFGTQYLIHTRRGSNRDCPRFVTCPLAYLPWLLYYVLTEPCVRCGKQFYPGCLWVVSVPLGPEFWSQWHFCGGLLPTSPSPGESTGTGSGSMPARLRPTRGVRPCYMLQLAKPSHNADSQAAGRTGDVLCQRGCRPFRVKHRPEGPVGPPLQSVSFSRRLLGWGRFAATTQNEILQGGRGTSPSCARSPTRARKRA